jgi:hypothetical protein
MARGSGTKVIFVPMNLVSNDGTGGAAGGLNTTNMLQNVAQY